MKQGLQVEGKEVDSVHGAEYELVHPASSSSLHACLVIDRRFAHQCFCYRKCGARDGSQVVASFEADCDFAFGKRHEHACHMGMAFRCYKANTQLIAYSGIETSRDDDKVRLLWRNGYWRFPGKPLAGMPFYC